MAIFLRLTVTYIFNQNFDIVCALYNCMEIILMKTMNGLNLEFNEWAPKKTAIVVDERKKLTTYMRNWIRCLHRRLRQSLWHRLDWSTSTNTQKIKTWIYIFRIGICIRIGNYALRTTSIWIQMATIALYEFGHLFPN